MRTSLFTRFTTDNRGSMPFAILLSGLVMIIATTTGSAVAWQTSTVTNQHGGQDARWAANNAVNVAMQCLSTVTPGWTPSVSLPCFDGQPLKVIAETDAVPDQNDWPWLEMPHGTVNDSTSTAVDSPMEGVAFRWLAVRKTVDTPVISIIGQGRSGYGTSPAHDTVGVTLTYDYSTGAWTPGSVVSLQDVPTT